MDKLLAWEGRKLVIIHGPAGQGKSTLAAEYAGALSAPAVWYTMDRDDENPAQFLGGLSEAMGRIFPGPLPDPPPVPRYRYGIAGARAAVANWTARVFGQLQKPCRIVLDDCHAAADTPALREVLNALLFSTPPSVRFLLLSRARPELDIARLRALQQVGELTGDDLRFSNDEAYRLFTGIFAMQIARRDGEAINRLAEGWPAGLVLMHEYLSAAPQAVAGLLAERRGHPGMTAHVFDYLAQEVFDRLSPDLKRFLLRTSVVDYLTPDLAEILGGTPVGASAAGNSVPALLEELRRKNLFVTFTDGGTPVVRYHALFRDFLRNKREASAKPAELKRLCSAAARHFRKSGDTVRTVDLYLESRQEERAVGLIESTGPSLIASGRTRTLIGWLDALPPKFRERPWLCYFRAVALRFTDSRAALALFERAQDGFQRDRTARRRAEGMMLSLGGVIEACFHSGGGTARMARAAAQTGRLLARERGAGGAGARLLLALGMARFFAGELREGAEALSRALELFRKQRDRFSQIQCAIYLAPCAVYLADFPLAREAVRKGFEALKHVPEEKGGEAALYTVQAMTALNEGNFDEARQCVDKSRALAREHGLEAFDFLALDIGGWLAVATGEHGEAERLLTECRQKGRELGNEFFSASSSHLLSLNELHRNRLAKARAEAATALKARAWSGSKLFYGVSLAANGAIELKSGNLSRAARELRRARSVLRKIGAAQQEANVLLILAKLALLRGRDSDARDCLRAGFRIGQERGFTYYGTIGPEDLAELAEQARARGICPDYCETLLGDHLGQRVAPAVRVRALGGFRVSRGDRQISDAEWKSKRAKTFLKLLVAHEGRKLSRDAAVDILWPEGQGNGVLQSFTALLHRMRKVLGPGAARNGRSSSVVMEELQLALDRKTVWTDTGEFLSWIEHAGRMKAKKDNEGALKCYQKAFDLYAGDFLPDDLYEDWALPVRERFRRLYFKALEDAAALAESMDRRDDAFAFTEKLFDADPGNEKACRWLMERHVAEGRRSDAVRAYERCQRALAQDLETEPEEETRKLYRRIIGG